MPRISSRLGGSVANERRTARRYELAVPVKIDSAGLSEAHRFAGSTRDISTHGLYFTTDMPPAPGSLVTLKLTLPQSLTGGEEVIVELSARILRVEDSQRENTRRVGVAARIERYEIVRAAAVHIN